MKPGDVVLVRFPFAELAAAKKRPALATVDEELIEKPIGHRRLA